MTTILRGVIRNFSLKKWEGERKREVGSRWRCLVGVLNQRQKRQRDPRRQATALWVGWGRLPPPLPLVFPKSREVGQNPSQTSPQIPHPTYAYGLESMNHNGDVPSSRCPKHPSQPPFTGFCSACLLERLSTAPARCFPSPSPVAAAAEISTEIPQPRVRTTLLYLFQLDDDQEDQGQQVRVDQEDEQGRQLQRKRSLRQSCEWIVCCDATADSRQSWDGSADAPPPNSNPIIRARGFVTRPAQMLRRSLSESWRHARSRPAVPTNAASVSSAGMDSEISLGGDSSSIHAAAAAPRQSSLFKRLYRLGRSRSVHCSSPQIRSLDTGTLRFHLTPLTRNSSTSTRLSIANKIQGRRLNLFDFFANQRQQL
ncbi:uncharacterized protein LOC127762240 [Oryza glaberrima]|nr:uncharacterized protein LOC127762240 [Oryza glaberrima]